LCSSNCYIYIYIYLFIYIFKKNGKKINSRICVSPKRQTTCTASKLPPLSPIRSNMVDRNVRRPAAANWRCSETPSDAALSVFRLLCSETPYCQCSECCVLRRRQTPHCLCSDCCVLRRRQTPHCQCSECGVLRRRTIRVQNAVF